ncbi:hypothetical protein M3Y97_00509700 [Aphelenchoides bicaudatus]|nr:hypothetical protein M3Y97_00509700 [Aphelenchoides bicaudatus]
MLRFVLILLALIAVKCNAKFLHGDSPAEILIENVANYYETPAMDQSCIRKLPYNNAVTVHVDKTGFFFKSSPVRDVMDKIEYALYDNETEFCNLTFNTTLPALKFINKTCREKPIYRPDPVLNEAVFAVYYSSQQLLRKQSDWFSCKDPSGKELLGKIFKPEAYQHNYNIANGILAHKLPTFQTN